MTNIGSLVLTFNELGAEGLNCRNMFGSLLSCAKSYMKYWCMTWGHKYGYLPEFIGQSVRFHSTIALPDEKHLRKTFSQEKISAITMHKIREPELAQKAFLELKHPGVR